MGKSYRLKDYDYSEQAGYFLTICSNQRKNIFGIINSGIMIKSEIGNIVEEKLIELPKHFHNIEIDIYTIMPNHIHVIINLYKESNKITERKFGGVIENTISLIVGFYKSEVTKKVIKNNLLTEKVWQKNYFDRIIRNEIEENILREYIVNNPVNWYIEKDNSDEDNLIFINKD